MNLGLGNLTELKAQLLAKGLRASADFDAPITAIGVGVAGRFEKYCNRKFPRAVNAQFVCSADRDHVYLDRAPIEELVSVELKTDQAVGWELQSNLVANLNELDGFAFFGFQPGPHYGLLRFTFTGGFWFDESEDASGVMPVGAAALPADLKLAWFLQCRAVWNALDKLGTKITEVGEGTGTISTIIGELKLVAEAEATLLNYRRLQLT